MLEPWRHAGFPLGLTWKFPGALVLLLVPIGLLFLARRPARPREVATGALDLWRKVAFKEYPSAGRPRWVPPAWVLWASSALVLGVIGLAGPSFSGRPATRRWTVVLDRGPGLLLPYRSSVSDPKSVRSRLEVALGLARKYLTEVTAKGDRVRWEAAGREPLELGADALPDSAWLLPLRASTGGSPAWERYTEAGCIWVTDRRPEQDPGDAAMILSGGASIPGAIAVAGDECLNWTGDAPLGVKPGRKGTLVFKRIPIGHAEQGEQRPGPPLPRLLENLVRAWARSRGLGLVRDAAPPEDKILGTPERPQGLEDDVVLVVEGFGTKESIVTRSDERSELGATKGTDHFDPGVLVDFRVREVGFEASGSCLDETTLAAGLGSTSGAAWGESPLTARWWADTQASNQLAGPPLLYSQPGRARFSIVELDPPSGDPAAFAVRVAQFLDQALLLPPGVIPLEARRDAGPQLVVSGKSPNPMDRLALESDFPLGVWLAGLATLAAFVALVGRWSVAGRSTHTV